MDEAATDDGVDSTDDDADDGADSTDDDANDTADSASDEDADWLGYGLVMSRCLYRLL